MINKLYRIALFSILLFSTVISNGQNQVYNCQLMEHPEPVLMYNGNCNTDPNGEWMIYRNMNTYIPDMNPSTPLRQPPIKTIEININIIQKNDGSGNFEDNQNTIDRFTNIISYVNSFYSSYSPSDPISWVEELPNNDSRIRFSIGESGKERIYFYEKSDAWGNTDPRTTILPYISTHHPERLEQLNLFIFGKPNNNWAHANFPSWTNFDHNSWVAMFYWDGQIQDWAKATLLAHEFGHNLGLLHTYSGALGSAICDQSNEEFLQDVFLIELPSTSNCPHTGNWHDDPYLIIGDGITNNLLGGTSEQRYISPQQGGQMHRALAVTSIRKYVSSEKSSIPLELFDNHVWDFDMKLYRDLIIHQDAHLTLSCNLVMHPDAKIIIKPGGILTIDGGVIGTDIYEKNSWQGIEVWGNSTASQIALPGQPNPQGKLILKNGARIENAHNGVTLWKPGDYNTTGGIIIANDAVFRNNRRSVEFMSYQNFNPLNPLDYEDNASSFTNCTFVANEDYESPNAFHAHITLWEVDGVKFYGNTFQSSLDDSPGKGIYSIDASYKLIPWCSDQSIPCQNLVLNRFIGFDAAIEASASVTGPLRTIFVDSAQFINNGYGIKLSSLNNASITNSVFEIGNYTSHTCTTDFGIGIELSECNGYLVEGNHFSLATDNSDEGSIGIRVYNNESSLPEANEIYRNSFNGLDRGNLAEGINISNTTIEQGLVYQCNQNTDNYCDFHITGEGIARHQGSLNIPAGNTFSFMSGVFMSPRHIFNYSTNHIDYYYSSAQNQEPLYFINTTKHPTVNFNSCLSSFGGGSGQIDLLGLSPDQQIYFAEQSASSRAALNSLSNLYSSLVDGGSTTSMLTAVETALPGDMWDLRAQLLGGAPHLSKEVLKKAADRTDVLPESIIFELLSTNPDELKDAELIEFLQTKSNPLPEEMIEVLIGLRDNITYKTILQSQMGQYGLQQFRADRALLHDLVHNHSSDLEGIRNLLAAAQSLPMDMQLVELFMQERKTEQALSLAAMLPQLYSLSNKELEEYNRFVSLKQLQANIWSEGRSIFDLEPSEKSLLFNLMDESQGLAGTQARNILAFIGDYEYCDCPAILDDELKTQAISAKNIQTLLAPSLNVLPNPANAWVSFGYTLSDEKSQAVLEIYDVAGKTIHQAQLSQSKGEYVWDTRQLQPGTYYYSVKAGGSIKTGKLVIIK